MATRGGSLGPVLYVSQKEEKTLEKCLGETDRRYTRHVPSWSRRRTAWRLAEEDDPSLER